MNKVLVSVFGVCALATVVHGCNKGYGGFEGGLHGWGGAPVIVLPKPTLLPKLKQAYIDGKLGVNYHKIVGPSLKPLPYKKGVGWIGKGWGHGFGIHHGVGLHHGVGFHHGFNSIGHDIHSYHNYHIGKQGLLGKGIGYGKSIGFEKGIGISKGVGIGYGKGIDVGYGKGFGYGGVPHLGYGHHGHFGHGIGHPGIGISNHVVNEQVSVVGKGVPGLHQPILGPHGIHG